MAGTIKMFNVNIPFYSLAILAALLSNIIVILSQSQKCKNLNNSEIMGLLIYENLGMISGAKILSFILAYKEFNGKFSFLNLGLTAYGAVIGAMLLIILFCYQYKKSLKEILHLILPSMPLMYSIGKLGCFLVGCCYGMEYHGIGKVMYQYSNAAPNGVYLFPVQLLESILFFLIFIYINYKNNRDNSDINTINICLIVCGITKFSLDFLRMSHHNSILSPNQYISLCFVIIGFIGYLKNKKDISKIEKVSTNN